MKSSSWKSSWHPEIASPATNMPVVKGALRSRASHKVVVVVAVVAEAVQAVSRKSIARVPTATVVAVRANRRPVAAAIRSDRFRLSG